jgi:hypothetical protein
VERIWRREGLKVPSKKPMSRAAENCTSRAE